MMSQATNADAARVLVVDDEPGVLRMLGRILRRHQVVSVSSAAQAMAAVASAQGRFDLVLCDLVMPGSTGVDLHQWLAATYPALADRTVFLTGGVDDLELQRYLVRECCPLIRKPFVPSRLLATVSVALAFRCPRLRPSFASDEETAE